MNKRRWAPFKFLLIPVILYGIWVIAPIFYTIFLSFTQWDGLTAPTFVGISNYLDLFNDPIFFTALFNNIKWLLIYILVPLPLGLAFAMFFNRSLPGVKIFKTAIYLPLTLSFVVLSQIWTWIYQPEYGALNVTLEAMGLGNLTVAWLSNSDIVTYSLIVVGCWPQTAYTMVLFLAGLQNVPTEVMEAAKVDGANRWQRFWKVILPLLKPSTIIAVAVTIIQSLRMFAIVNVMTRGGPFRSSEVLANYMYVEGFKNYSMGYASALAVVLFVIILLFVFIYLYQIFKTEVEF
ncbi:sugar ABC transporter permease [Candidatus Bipolaricaulota bacterium]|nr:sugar ABC transporter permease [Candidatus Bipolaricaulota bacterium]